MKRALACFITSMLVFSTFSIYAPRVEASSILKVPDDYVTIHEAINAANPGDTIYVRAGTYYEHVVVNKPVSVIGENRETTIIDGSETGTVVIITQDNVNITGFTIQESGDGSYYSDVNAGIIITQANNCNITNNRITRCKHGVVLGLSSNNTFRGNSIANNKYNFGVEGLSLSDYVNDIDTSNTVDCKPVYYWVNRRHMTIPPDAGYVGLINCTEITVKNLNLANNRQGILMVYTANSTVARNNIENNYYGMRLDGSSNNTVYANNIMNNTYEGVNLEESSATILACNEITNSYHGLFGGKIRDVSILNNTVMNNLVVNIILIRAVNSTLSSNRIANSFEGIDLWDSSNNTLCNNNVTKNSRGIWLEDTFANTLFGNYISNNTGCGLLIGESSDTLAFHNNFIKNRRQTYVWPTSSIWDDGYPSGGNYWSDQDHGACADHCSGPYQNETGSDGIVDTPYVIDPNNQDNYPLMNPWIPTPEPDFQISVYPSYQAIIQGKSATYSVALKSLEGYSSPVSLTLSGLPSDTSHSFDPEVVVPDSSSTLTITTTSTTTEGSYTLAITGEGERTHSATATLTVVSQWITLTFHQNIPESNRTYISQLFDEVYPQLVMMYGYPSTYYRLHEPLTVNLKYDPKTANNKYDHLPPGPSGRIIVNDLPHLSTYLDTDLYWDRVFTHELTHSFHDALMDLILPFWAVGPWVEEGMTEAASEIALLELKTNDIRETMADAMLNRYLKSYDVWNHTGRDILGVRGHVLNKLEMIQETYYDNAAAMWFILTTDLATNEAYDFMAKLNKQMYFDADYALILDDTWVKQEVDKVAGTSRIEGHIPSEWISLQSVTETSPESGDQLAVYFDHPENPFQVSVITFKRNWVTGKETPKGVSVSVQIIDCSGSVVSSATVETDEDTGLGRWDLEDAGIYPLPIGAYQVVATAKFGRKYKTATNYGLSLGEDKYTEAPKFYGVTLDSSGTPVEIEITTSEGEVIDNDKGLFVIQTHIVTIPFEIVVVTADTQRIFAKPNPFTRIVSITVQT